MAKGRIVALVIIGIMLLTAVMPQVASAAAYTPSDKPDLVAPYDNATEIGPSFVFRFSSPDPAPDAEYYGYQVQYRTPVGTYDLPLFDSGFQPSGEEAVYPAGAFDYGETYYWRVRAQDSLGHWTGWSAEARFTVVTNSPPSQPQNFEPDDSAAGVSLSPSLQACEFRDPNASEVVLGEADAHAASRWQIAASASHDKNTDGSYKTPVYDSDNVTTSLTSIVVPAGYLNGSASYYWHVKYQDSYGHWSAYSSETSFSTAAAKAASAAPVASFSADKTSVTAGTELVTFTDNSTPAGEITAWSWNFGDGVTENWTLLDRPSNGQITHKYTIGGTQTVKLTVTNAVGTDDEVKDAYVVVHAKPEASIGVLTAPAKAGEEIAFKDNSSPTEDITSWEWQFDDGTTVQWTAAERQAAGGQIKHVFKKAGTHTVSLTVAGALGESYYNKPINVTGGGGFRFGLWMIGVAVAAVVVVAGVMYLVRARKGK
jgi:PKD repeat protein